MTIEHKTLVFTKAEITDAGELQGYGAWFNNVDDGGDVIEPGFFADVIPDFLTEGFVAWGHDWDDPCAMPTAAREDAVGLALNGIFHSDAQSQRYRTIAKERLDRGLSMGLSIGYEIAPGGAKRAADGTRHLLKASRLFEVSLVMVPMNREATVTAVKTARKAAADNVDTASWMLRECLQLIQAEAADLEPDDPDVAEDQQDLTTLGLIRDLITQYIAATAAEVGTPDDLTDVAEEEAARAAAWSDWGWGYMGRTAPLAEHADRVALAVKGLRTRVKQLSRLRTKEGRVLSSANVERMQGHIDTLTALRDDMKDLLASATAEKRATPEAIELDYELTRARFMGVPI